MLNIKKSIYRKIALSFIISSLIPLITLSFFSYSGYVSSIESKTTTYNNEIMKFFSEKMEDYIRQIEQISAIVYQENIQTMIVNIDKQDTIEKLRTIMDLDRIFLNQTYSLNFSNTLKEIFILDASGNQIYSNTGYAAKGSNFLETDWFNAFIESGLNRTVTLPHLKENYTNENLKEQMYTTEHLTLTYVRRIGSTGSQNSYIGYIIIHFGLNEVESYLKPLETFESSEVTVLDRENQIIYQKDLTLIGSKSELYDPSMQDSANGYFIKKENGKRLLISWYESSLLGWRIITSNDIGELTKDTAVIRKTLIILTSTTILSIILISLFVSKEFLKPIRKLRKAMLKVHDGNLNISVPKLSDDEIGDLGMVFNEMLDNIRNLVNEVYTTKLREKQAQLDTLQAQINPHFLYNTLENIRSIAYIEGVEDISKIASAMSNMFRYSISQGGTYVRVYDEIAHINDYIDIISVRHGGSIEVQREIPEDLLDYSMIKFILQPVLENAVFHGLEMKRGKRLLQIKAQRLGETIHFIISDNGVGIKLETLEQIRETLQSTDKADLNKSSKEISIGLKNVHDRIRLHYGKRYGIHIESKPDIGTKVEIIIPAINFVR